MNTPVDHSAGLVQIGHAKRVFDAALSMPTLADTLARVRFFEGFDETTLSQIARSAFLRRYAPSDVVFEQGHYGHSLFVLVQGQVDLRARADNGQALRLGRLTEPGEFFGELSVLGRTRRPASAIAVEETVALEIEKTKLERIDKEQGGVLERIEALSQRRAIHTFLTQHRGFAALDDATVTMITELASLAVHHRGSTIFERGDAADHVLLIKSGVAKLVREDDRGVAVLAYFSAGDVIGLSDGATRPAELVSMGYVEMIRTARSDFEMLERVRPGFFDQFKKAEVDQSSRVERVITTNARGSDTLFMFVDQLVADGAQEAQSLLTIDLNLCVRCGNCVQACEARHGHPKMTRRGKKLRRREQVERAGKYQDLLLPSSCRHCSNPECMIGCPTGAIHRLATGEVDVHDFCIGCSNCAHRCPWDNITMVATPDREVDGQPMKQIASKCNLCAGYEGANCVNNCPVNAILRIEPNTYFSEVEQILGKAAPDVVQAPVGEGRTTEQTQRDVSRWLIPASAIVVASILVAIAVFARGRSTYSTVGIAFGVVALASMVGATGLAARRRASRMRIQLGPFHVWVRGHVWLGGLTVVAALLHSGFSLGGVLTAFLMSLLLLTAITGVAGRLFYRWLPRVITNIEGDSQVEEDLLEEQRALRRRARELSALSATGTYTSAKRAASATGSVIRRYSTRYDPAIARALALVEAQGALAALEDEPARRLEQLVVDAVRGIEIDAALILYRVRQFWLVSHIGLTASLLTLTFVHIGSVLYF